MNKDVPATRILIIDSDEASYQFCRCMAQVLVELPPLEFYHAHDASEGLGVMDAIQPDVVVLAEDSEEERELLLDSLTEDHPPVIIQTSGDEDLLSTNTGGLVTEVTMGETLEGIHKTLMLASSLANRRAPRASSPDLH